MPPVAFVVPGWLDTLTGGYGYDRRMVAGLRARGWIVDVYQLDGTFPSPSARALDAAACVFAGMADRALVVVDGLAFGAIPEVAELEARRLRLVALVHHPLSEETGLDREEAARLTASERRALATARLVIVTSRATAVNLSSYHVAQDRIAVVEPGTDRAPLARGSGGDGVHLLCVAAIVPRKGHAALLNALAAIPERNWHLSCVGSVERDWAMAERLRRMIDRLGLGDRVALVGERDEAGVSEAYDRADAFVLPTLHEGYGMAVAEALARGLPVISTPTGAIADLIVPPETGGSESNAAGILVPPGDGAALVAALRLVIGSPHVRDSLAAGARRVRDRLPTWDDQSARMAEALSRV